MKDFGKVLWAPLPQVKFSLLNEQFCLYYITVIIAYLYFLDLFPFTKFVEFLYTGLLRHAFKLSIRKCLKYLQTVFTCISHFNISTLLLLLLRGKNIIYWSKKYTSSPLYKMHFLFILGKHFTFTYSHAFPSENTLNVSFKSSSVKDLGIMTNILVSSSSSTSLWLPEDLDWAMKT